MNKPLDDLRKEIDLIDEELLSVISKRIDIVHKIGKLKKEKNLAVLDEKRRESVLKRLKETAGKHNLPEELVEKIYEEIHKTALKIEKKYE